MAIAGVLTNAGVLVDNGVADDAVLADPDGDAAGGYEGLPLLLALVIIRANDHCVLHIGTERSTCQPTPAEAACLTQGCTLQTRSPPHIPLHAFETPHTLISWRDCQS